LAAAVSLAALIFVGYVKNVPVIHELVTRPMRAHASAPDVAPRTPGPAQPVSPPANLVRIRWRPQNLVPAANAGRICVTVERRGRICASYVVGERPADDLTREIERRGLRVQSSG
jgi:hypothetical protein